MGRPPFSNAVWRVFWSAIRSGALVDDAADRAGVSRPTAWRRYGASGGVMPQLPDLVPPASGGRLTAGEREEIALLRAQKLGVNEIARRVGRPACTISRELDRNGAAGGRYLASVAQQRAEARAREAGLRPSPAKLATHLRLRSEVQERLRTNHSPEQIARRLREDFPDDPEMWVSHETIYQSIYIQSRGGLKRELAKHLRTGRVLRQPQRQARARTARVARIKDMVMISERPAEVEDRAVPGHWESQCCCQAA